MKKIKEIAQFLLCVLLASCGQENLSLDIDNSLDSIQKEEDVFIVPDTLCCLNDTITYNTVTIKYNDFEYINTGVDLSTSVGEAFLGVTNVGNWLVQAPQDHHSIVFYNIKTGMVKELDVSKYTRAIPKEGSDFRDKFNGVVSSHQGRFLWVCPSWTSYLLKIDITTCTVVKEFMVNNTSDDAYNEMVLTDNYLWLVTHSKEDLPRIDIHTDEVKIFEIEEDNLGDYNFGQGANNRSFYAGADNLDGHIFFYPRRSKYLLKIDEETGTVVSKYKHPLAEGVSPSYGYFHGAIKANNKIYFSPWSSKKIIVFDIVSESFNVIETNVSGNLQYNFSSTFDGQYVWMAPFRSKELIRIDTDDDSVEEINVQKILDVYTFGRTRKESSLDVGFAGGALFIDETIWFSAVFESSFVKIPLNY